MESERHRERILPWQSSKEFLTSTPRGAKLRAISVAVIRRLNLLLYSPDVAGDTKLQAQIYAELEHLNGQLIEEGIEKEMHTGQPLEYFQSNPEACSEYVAGNILLVLGEKFVSESEAMPIVQEFNIGENEYPLVDMSARPPRLINYFSAQIVVNTSSRMLSMEREEAWFE